MVFVKDTYIQHRKSISEEEIGKNFNDIADQVELIAFLE